MLVERGEVWKEERSRKTKGRWKEKRGKNAGGMRRGVKKRRGVERKKKVEREKRKECWWKEERCGKRRGVERQKDGGKRKEERMLVE